MPNQEEEKKEIKQDKLPKFFFGTLSSLIISYVTFHVLFFIGDSYKGGAGIVLLFLMVPITALISLIICFFYTKKVLSFLLFFLLNQIMIWTLIQFILNNYY